MLQLKCDTCGKIRKVNTRQRSWELACEIPQNSYIRDSGDADNWLPHKPTKTYWFCSKKCCTKWEVKNRKTKYPTHVQQKGHSRHQYPISTPQQ